jgi:lysozyme family protein
MKENFGLAFHALLKHEGGFVNHPKDPGGMTNLGVTKRAWEDYVGHPVDEAQMRALTPETVETFYRERYWNVIGGDSLPGGVDYCVFDCTVNSGPRQAVRLLQRAARIKDDGILGPNTLNAVRSMDPRLLISRYTAARLDFLQKLPTFTSFGKGWVRRVREVESLAATLV